MIIKQKNCSNCRVGMESYRLDVHSEMCPYIVNLKKNKCRFYKPLKKEKKYYVRSFINTIFRGKK